MKINENTNVALPIRNLLAIVAAVAIGAWAYFGVIERLNNLETKAQLSEKDLNQAEEAILGDVEKLKDGQRRLKHSNGG